MESDHFTEHCIIRLLSACHLVILPPTTHVHRQSYGPHQMSQTKLLVVTSTLNPLCNQQGKRKSLGAVAKHSALTRENNHLTKKTLLNSLQHCGNVILLSESVFMLSCDYQPDPTDSQHGSPSASYTRWLVRCGL